MMYRFSEGASAPSFIEDYVQAAYSGAMKVLTQADKLSDCLSIMKEVRDIATRLCNV